MTAKSFLKTGSVNHRIRRFIEPPTEEDSIVCTLADECMEWVEPDPTIPRLHPRLHHVFAPSCPYAEER